MKRASRRGDTTYRAECKDTEYARIRAMCRESFEKEEAMRLQHLLCNLLDGAKHGGRQVVVAEPAGDGHILLHISRANGVKGVDVLMLRITEGALFANKEADDG